MKKSVKEILSLVLYFASIGLLSVIYLGAYLDSTSMEKELRNQILIFTFLSVTFVGVIFVLIFETYLNKKF